MTERQKRYLWNRINPVFADMWLDGIEETKDRFLDWLDGILDDIGNGEPELTHNKIIQKRKEKQQW